MASSMPEVKEGRKRWPKGLDIKAKDFKSEEVTKFMEYKLLEYKACELKDVDLWEQFRDDFNTFSVQDFKESNQTTLRKFRQFLRTCSI